MAMGNTRNSLIKDVFCIFLGFLVAVFLYFDLPVVAFTSANGVAQCLSNPACASSMGATSAITGGTATANTAAGVTVGGAVVSIPVAPGTIPLGGIIGGSFVAGGLTVGGIAAIRDRAAEKYATPNGAGTLTITHLQGNGTYNIQVRNNVTSYQQPFLQRYQLSGGQNVPVYRVTYVQNGVTQTGDYFVNKPTLQFEGPLKGWDDLTPEEKTGALGGLTPDDYNDVAAPGGANGSPTEVPLPSDSPEIEILPDTPIKFSPPGSEPTDDPPISPADTPINFPNPGYDPTSDPNNDPNSDPNPDLDPNGDLDGDGEPNETDTDADGDGIEDVSVDNNSLPLPELQEIPVQDFSGNENFLSHGVNVLSNKFPFDIMGEFSAPGVPDCPNYTFFGRTQELCPIRDIVAASKYPAIISVLIWALMAL